MGGFLKTVLVLLLLSVSSVALAKGERVLSWQDCVMEAAKSNPALAASYQQIEQDKAQKWVSTSPQLPQVSVNAGASRTDSVSGGAERNNYSYSVQGEQLIFDGFKTYNDVQSAKADIKSSTYGYDVTSSEVRYGLRKAFVELLKAQDLVPITESIIERRKQNYDMIRLRYESGREHEGALLLAEADLAQAKLDLRKAKRSVSIAQYALRKQLGWNRDIPIKVKGRFVTQISAGTKPDLKEIADKHPGVDKYRFDSESAKYALRSAKAEFFPEIRFNTEAGKRVTGGIAGDDMWSVGVDVSLPVFEGGRRIANTDKAGASLMQSQFNVMNEYDSVLSTLEQAWQDMKDAIEEVSVQKKYLKASEVRAKIARAQYENGLLIFDDWVIIEDSYISRQQTFLSYQANMLIAEAEWIRARGGVLTYEE